MTALTRRQALTLGGLTAAAVAVSARLPVAESRPTLQSQSDFAALVGRRVVVSDSSGRRGATVTSVETLPIRSQQPGRGECFAVHLSIDDGAPDDVCDLMAPNGAVARLFLVATPPLSRRDPSTHVATINRWIPSRHHKSRRAA